MNKKEIRKVNRGLAATASSAGALIYLFLGFYLHTIRSIIFGSICFFLFASLGLFFMFQPQIRALSIYREWDKRLFTKSKVIFGVEFNFPQLLFFFTLSSFFSAAIFYTLLTVPFNFSFMIMALICILVCTSVAIYFGKKLLQLLKES